MSGNRDLIEPLVEIAFQLVARIRGCTLVPSYFTCNTLTALGLFMANLTHQAGWEGWVVGSRDQLSVGGGSMFVGP